MLFKNHYAKLSRAQEDELRNKLVDQTVWEGRQYIWRSGDDKVPTDEGRLLLLLNHDAELIQHFEETPGKFRADVRTRGVRFVSHKDRPFRTIPLKDPRNPLAV